MSRVLLPRRGVLAAGLLAGTGLVACARGEEAAPSRSGSASADPGTDVMSGTGSGPPAAVAALVPRAVTYGEEDLAQRAELTLPQGQPAAVVALLHGGFWRAEYDLTLASPLAADLAARGYATWNIEYRRVGAGGGWPQTFTDVAAALDHLAELPETADLPVVVVGHSAGGHLAAWLAARPVLPDGAVGADPGVVPVGVISQAGVLDLTAAAQEGIGGSAVPDLLGGLPDAVPDRYAVGDPARLLPVGVPLRCVHGSDDTIVPLRQSEDVAAAARAAGDDAQVLVVDGDHFTIIDPASEAWVATVDIVADLLPGR